MTKQAKPAKVTTTVTTAASRKADALPKVSRAALVKYWQAGGAALNAGNVLANAATDTAAAIASAKVTADIMAKVSWANIATAVAESPKASTALKDLRENHPEIAAYLNPKWQAAMGPVIVAAANNPKVHSVKLWNPVALATSGDQNVLQRAFVMGATVRRADGGGYAKAATIIAAAKSPGGALAKINKVIAADTERKAAEKAAAETPKAPETPETPDVPETPETPETGTADESPESVAADPASAARIVATPATMADDAADIVAMLQETGATFDPTATPNDVRDAYRAFVDAVGAAANASLAAALERVGA